VLTCFSLFFFSSGYEKHREVNVDSNTVGWYSSTYLGSFLNEGTIETQFNYQERIKKCVVLIYDPLKTSTGFLSLRAYRLTPAFMKLYKSKKFTKERFSFAIFFFFLFFFSFSSLLFNCSHELSFSLVKSNVSLQDIFEEIPVKINNLHLVNAFLFDLEASRTEDIEFNRLDLSFNPFLEKNLEVSRTLPKKTFFLIVLFPNSSCRSAWMTSQSNRANSSVTSEHCKGNKCNKLLGFKRESEDFF
jgi:hypothetical protein